MSELPSHMAGLPQDDQGWPIPWWAATLAAGGRDCRFVDQAKHIQALRFGLCWICGKPGGVHKAFALCPTAALAGVSAVPGQHRDCAFYAASGCPHLLTPDADDLPPVCVVVITRRSKVLRGSSPRVLLGQVSRLWWFLRGTAAEPAEVAAWLETTAGGPAVDPECQAVGRLLDQQAKRSLHTA